MTTLPTNQQTRIARRDTQTIFGAEWSSYISTLPLNIDRLVRELHKNVGRKQLACHIPPLDDEKRFASHTTSVTRKIQHLQISQMVSLANDTKEFFHQWFDTRNKILRFHLCTENTKIANDCFTKPKKILLPTIPTFIQFHHIRKQFHRQSQQSRIKDMTNFISHHEKLHFISQELHTIHKQQLSTTNNNTRRHKTVSAIQPSR